MWRREERLRYWLENGSRPQKTGFGSGLIKKLSLKWRLGPGDGAVQEESLNIRADTLCLDDALVAPTCVKDGLEDLGGWMPRSFASIPGSSVNHTRTHPVVLLGGAKAFNTRLMDSCLAPIRQERLIPIPYCKPFGLGIHAVDIHELKHPQNQPPLLRDGNPFLIANPAVQILTSQISELPQARASVKIDGLKDSERKGFLREAETLKGVPAGRAELLAVFRHVPIEMVSRLRFLAEKKVILYSIPPAVKPSRTRLHDLAAVLDTASREIHLVPHRAQFRSVALN